MERTCEHKVSDTVFCSDKLETDVQALPLWDILVWVDSQCYPWRVHRISVRTKSFMWRYGFPSCNLRGAQRERERDDTAMNKHHHSFTRQGRTELKIEYPCFSASSYGMSRTRFSSSNKILMCATVYCRIFGPWRFSSKACAETLTILLKFVN